MNAVTRRIAFIVAGLLALTPAAPYAAWGHVDRITFSKAVALPGVVLPAGSYTFEAAPPMSSDRVVRVIDRQTRHVYFAGVTTAVRRPARGPEIVIVEDAPAGQPVAITDWYPGGGTMGRQFIYR